MDWRRADGTVLVVVLAATLLLSAVTTAMVVASSSEVMIADNFRRAMEALDAADAAAERALGDLVAVPQWDDVLGGGMRSTFVDGPPLGARTLPDGSPLNLERVVALANCRRASGCSGADMDMVTSERPWGRNNPRWQPYAYGRLADLLPGRVDSPYYVLVMVGDDPSETDQDPLHDGGGGPAAGAGALLVRAEAFGPRSAHRVVELVVQRTSTAHLRIVSWCAVR